MFAEFRKMAHTKTLDRRESLRIDVELKCIVRLGGLGFPALSAFTVNLSRGGALLRWPHLNGDPPPKVGQTLALYILLPAPPEFGERSISCSTVVTRVELKGGVLSVGVRIQRFTVGLTTILTSQSAGASERPAGYPTHESIVQ